jgi:hypothetical protein
MRHDSSIDVALAAAETGMARFRRSAVALRAAVLAALVLAGSAAPAVAEILRLGLHAGAGAGAGAVGSETYCATGPDARFSWGGEDGGALVPEQGLFSYFRPGEACTCQPR